MYNSMYNSLFLSSICIIFLIHASFAEAEKAKTLIYPKSGGNLKLDTSVFGQGLNSNDEIVFVPVLGSFQTGKSFLLTQLSGSLFKSGDSMTPETSSIQVSRPVPISEILPPIEGIPERYLIFVDTVGLDAPTDSESDMDEQLTFIKKMLFPLMATSNMVLFNFQRTSGASISKDLKFAIDSSTQQDVSFDHIFTVGRDASPNPQRQKIYIEHLKEKMEIIDPDSELSTSYHVLPFPTVTDDYAELSNIVNLDRAWHSSVDDLLRSIAYKAGGCKPLTLASATTILKDTLDLAEKGDFGRYDNMKRAYEESLIQTHEPGIRKELTRILLKKKLPMRDKKVPVFIEKSLRTAVDTYYTTTLQPITEEVRTLFQPSFDGYAGSDLFNHMVRTETDIYRLSNAAKKSSMLRNSGVTAVGAVVLKTMIVILKT
eukprot:gnl/Dysnectes_brevis/2549_a3068_2035.p1 GENE.gnl/Dysnectes_brevis/2549_a3068_2035~~gnl/Dysnectes_brevis/2549_a3068_2035.p1  ORF type:complete len:429 (+),score=130.93 gnl/Dysnectes_brevis/2549_a3068_2035:70-1356(+)